jgi:hypothetical protein
VTYDVDVLEVTNICHLALNNLEQDPVYKPDQYISHIITHISDLRLALGLSFADTASFLFRD